MKRTTTAWTILPGIVNWVSYAGSQLIDSDGNTLVFNASLPVYPIVLTAPPRAFRLTVPERRKYSKTVTVDVAVSADWVTDTTDNLISSAGDTITFNAAISSSATPIALTIPPSDNALVVGG